MRIAVLSDIHGNLAALQEVIKDAKAQQVDKFILLGDLITDFPCINEVIDQIKEVTPYVIRGNRENYLLEYEKTKTDPKWNSIQNDSIRYYYENLTTENREYIRKLQNSLSLEFEGVTIKAVHASLYSDTQLVYFEDTKLIEQTFQDLKEDVLLYGHTHREVGYQERNGKVIVQAGVVGMHNNESNHPQYAILECYDGKVKVQKRMIDYSKEELKKQIRQTGVLEKTVGIWTNFCYYCLETGIDLREQFRQEAKVLMNEKYHGKLPEGIYSNFQVIDDDIYLKLGKEYKKYFLL